MTEGQVHPLPVHRLVNWRVRHRTYRKDVACGAENTKHNHTTSAAVTCNECLEQTPGLQMLGKLEEVLDNLEVLPLPQEAKDALRRLTSGENTPTPDEPEETSQKERPDAEPPQKRQRPRTLNSTTTLLRTEQGDLNITVSKDPDGHPFEVFGALGKAGGLEHGMTELACRLISLHLRRDTPIEEIIEQCQGIQEMQPWPNQGLDDDETVYVLGLGDGIAHVLSRLDQIEQQISSRNQPPAETQAPEEDRPADGD